METSKQQTSSKEFILKQYENGMIKLVVNENSVMFVETQTKIEKDCEVSKKIINDVAKDSISTITYEEVNSKQSTKNVPLAIIGFFVSIFGLMFIIMSMASKSDGIFLVPGIILVVISIVLLLISNKVHTTENTQAKLNITDKNDKTLLSLAIELTDQELVNIITICRE